MKTDQRSLIIKDLNAYLPKGGEMAEAEKRIWNNVLKEKNYGISKKAFDALWIESPPCENYSRLPDSRRFEEIYKDIATPTVKKCSCCGGLTWLIFEHKDGKTSAYDCKCYLNAGLAPRTKKYNESGWSECDSLDCPNPGKEEKIVVSKGSYRYYKKLLSTCPYVKTITEAVETHETSLGT